MKDLKFELNQQLSKTSVITRVQLHYTIEYVGEFDTNDMAAIPLFAVVTVRDRETGAIKTLESRPTVRLYRGQPGWASIMVSSDIPDKLGEYMVCAAVSSVDAGCTPVLLGDRTVTVSIRQ